MGSFMIGNYEKHAAVWDWDAYDQTEEYEYWLQYAKQYGASILVPMCALGQAAAYYARHGCTVTAFDLTPEMIDEGRKRFGNVENLTIRQGDIRTFSFDIPPADFAYCMDLGHILTMEDEKRALACLARHLRVGGGLVLEIGLPVGESFASPKREFHPRIPGYADKKVWKESSDRWDAETKRHYINQTVYIETDGVTEQFDHSFYLQHYDREEWLGAFRETGFVISNEYSSREVSSWNQGDSFWGVELKRISI